MPRDRRAFLTALAAFAVRPALAEDALPVVAAYERATGGRIGVYAENRASGQRLSWRADERFVMCSTFKASLAACVLARIDRGADTPDAMVPFGTKDLQPYAPVARENLVRGAMSVETMCRAAVELSDNTCANLLLARIGGPAALTAFWRKMGDAVSRLDHYEPELNRSPPGDPHDTTSPAAISATLGRLLLGDVLSTASAETLTRWMVDCKTGANRLRAGLPAAWRTVDKTGNNGKDASGDIAVTWPQPLSPIVIAVFVQGGRPTPDQVTTTFAEVARLVASRLA